MHYREVKAILSPQNGICIADVHMVAFIVIQEVNVIVLIMILKI